MKKGATTRLPSTCCSFHQEQIHKKKSVEGKVSQVWFLVLLVCGKKVPNIFTNGDLVVTYIPTKLIWRDDSYQFYRKYIDSFMRNIFQHCFTGKDVCIYIYILYYIYLIYNNIHIFFVYQQPSRYQASGFQQNFNCFRKTHADDVGLKFRSKHCFKDLQGFHPLPRLVHCCDHRTEGDHILDVKSSKTKKKRIGSMGRTVYLPTFTHKKTTIFM